MLIQNLRAVAKFLLKGNVRTDQTTGLVILESGRHLKLQHSRGPKKAVADGHFDTTLFSIHQDNYIHKIAKAFAHYNNCHPLKAKNTFTTLWECKKE